MPARSASRSSGSPSTCGSGCSPRRVAGIVSSGSSYPSSHRSCYSFSVALVGATLLFRSLEADRTLMRKLCLVLSLTGLRVAGYATDPWLNSTEIHRVTGDPARADHGAAAPQELNVVTWNIEQGLAYDRILSVLRR